MERSLTRPIRYLSPAELARMGDSRAAKNAMALRKHSLGALEQAYQLKKTMTRREACEKTGVSVSAFNTYAQFRRRQEGIPHKSATKSKIPPDIREKVYRLASLLYKRGWSNNQRKCWIEAGNRFSVNGRSIEGHYRKGLWTPSQFL